MIDTLLALNSHYSTIIDTSVSNYIDGLSSARMLGYACFIWAFTIIIIIRSK